MQLREVVDIGARLFARIDFAAAGDRWPALSFARRSGLRDFCERYRSERDLVLLVGADDPHRVRSRGDRGRLLSAVTVDASIACATREIVPPAAIEEERRLHHERWDWSLPIVRVWHFSHAPRMERAYPATFDKFAGAQTRGAAVEVPLEERARLLGEAVAPDELRRPATARPVFGAAALRSYEPDIARAVQLMIVRAQEAGRARFRRAPLRSLAGDSGDLADALRASLARQGGACALCGCAIPPHPGNRLLQLSADRIEGGDKAYGPHNLQATHLACNLGRGEGTRGDWDEFLAMVRADPPRRRR